MKQGGDPVAAALWRAYRRKRTLEARNALVENYLYLIERVILSKWGRRMKAEGNYVSPEELRGYGAAGLIRGIEGYDPNRGTAPETWLSSRIYWAVLNGLREYDPLKQVDRARVKRGQMAEPKVASPLVMSQIQGREYESSVAERVGGVDVPASLERVREVLAGRPEREVRALLMRHLEGGPVSWVAAAWSGRRWSPYRYQNVPGRVREKISKIGG